MAMTPTREQLQSIARAVAAHASAVTKAGLPHDSEHGIGEYAAILAACLAAPPQATPEPSIAARVRMAAERGCVYNVLVRGISVPTPEAAKLLAIEDAGHCARAALRLLGLPTE